MSVNSGSVSLSTTTPTLIYQTPDGVETHLVIQLPVGGEIGGSTMTLGAGLSPVSQYVVSGNQSLAVPVTLSNFTGAVYGMGSGTATFIAVDIQ